MNLDIKMPDEIGLMAIAASCECEVCQEIAEAWFAMFHVINRFEGLKKILVIGEDNIHDLKMIFILIQKSKLNIKKNCYKIWNYSYINYGWQ